MTKRTNPHEHGGGATGRLLGVIRALAICALTITVLGLSGMGAILVLTYVGDAPLETASGTFERYGVVGVSHDMRLTALWERLAAPIYTCASIAALSLVALVIRKPKPTRHSPMEEPA